MHLSDALLSPAVGGALWLASGTTLGLAAKKGLSPERQHKSIPLMGVMGAFVFAAQMVNVTIPGTGASGHITGGILLATLLGPVEALMTMASVLLVQALFFADGGLLAYGANLFNLGIIPCLLVYPLLFRPLCRRFAGTKHMTMVASILSVVIATQLGAFAIVLQAMWSGGTALSFPTFLLLMQPIHLAIGILEGIVTGLLLGFVARMRPDLVDAASLAAADAVTPKQTRKHNLPATLAVILLLALGVAGGVSLFASTAPDGLEWSLSQANPDPLEYRDGVLHQAADKVVEETALFPDYEAKNTADPQTDATRKQGGLSTPGLVGSLLTLLIASVISGGIWWFRRRRQ